MPSRIPAIASSYSRALPFQVIRQHIIKCRYCILSVPLRVVFQLCFAFGFYRHHVHNGFSVHCSEEHRRGALGEEQGRLGEQQGKLGEQQGREAKHFNNLAVAALPCAAISLLCTSKPLGVWLTANTITCKLALRGFQVFLISCLYPPATTSRRIRMPGHASGHSGLRRHRDRPAPS